VQESANEEFCALSRLQLRYVCVHHRSERSLSSAPVIALRCQRLYRSVPQSLPSVVLFSSLFPPLSRFPLFMQPPARRGAIQSLFRNVIKCNMDDKLVHHQYHALCNSPCSLRTDRYHIVILPSSHLGIHLITQTDNVLFTLLQLRILVAPGACLTKCVISSRDVLYVSPSTYTIQLTMSIAASSIVLTFHSTTASHSMYYLSQTLDERLTIAHSRPSCSTSRWVAKFVSTRHETHNWAILFAILHNP
jgi:hypothetical protein